MQGLSFFKVSVWRERGSFILEIAGDPFFFLGICHGFCYCLFESTWAELRGGVFVLFTSEMVQALAHVVLEKEKKSSLSRAEDVFRFQCFFTQYGKVARFTQRKAGFQHSVLITPFPFAARVSNYWSSSLVQWWGKRVTSLLRWAEHRGLCFARIKPRWYKLERLASRCTTLPYLLEGLKR